MPPRFQFLLLLFLFACGHPPPASTIAQRASIDLQCDAGDVLVRRMFGKTYETVGCGRRAVFVCNARECRRDTEVLTTEEGSIDGGETQVRGPAGVDRHPLWTVHAELEACVVEPTTLVVDVTDGRVTSFEAEETLSGNTRSCLARVLLQASVEGNLSAGPVRVPLREP